MRDEERTDAAAYVTGTSVASCPPAPWAESLGLDEVFVDDDYEPGTLRGTWRLIKTDFAMGRIYFRSAVTHLFPNVFVAVSYRVAHYLYRRGLRPLAGIVGRVAQLLTSAEIHYTARLGPGLVVIHPAAIVIGANVVSGRHLVLYGSNTLGWAVSVGGGDPGSPRLGNDVALFTHASVLGPVSVGDGVIVAAYALVVDDVPSGTVPRGVPARP